MENPPHPTRRTGDARAAKDVGPAVDTEHLKAENAPVYVPFTRVLEAFSLTDMRTRKDSWGRTEPCLASSKAFSLDDGHERSGGPVLHDDPLHDLGAK